MVKVFYVYIIVEIPALLDLSVSNRYTGLVRANIRYGRNIWREKPFNRECNFINRCGGGEWWRRINTYCSLCPEKYGSFNNVKRKLDFFTY